MYPEPFVSRNFFFLIGVGHFSLGHILSFQHKYEALERAPKVARPISDFFFVERDIDADQMGYRGHDGLGGLQLGGPACANQSTNYCSVILYGGV